MIVIDGCKLLEILTSLLIEHDNVISRRGHVCQKLLYAAANDTLLLIRLGYSITDITSTMPSEITAAGTSTSISASPSQASLFRAITISPDSVRATSPSASYTVNRCMTQQSTSQKQSPRHCPRRLSLKNSTVLDMKSYEVCLAAYACCEQYSPACYLTSR